jgi:hypothetical protein
MSYQIGIDTLRLQPTERVAHTEYAFQHRTLQRLVQEESGKAFNDAWELDFLWNSNDGPVNWADVGRTTDMGHAEYDEGGVDRREAKVSPFTDPEQVLEFDAVEEYGLPDFDELVEFYQNAYQSQQGAHPNQVVTGGYYKSIVSGAIQAFGWDMLLQAAIDQERFEQVLDSFFRLSLHHYRAWAKTSIEAFICHDDMVWSSGPFMDPEFYRRVIFPRYAELWKALKDEGKILLYCSDANWNMFLDDLVEAGADGFIFEPMVDLDPIVEKYGSSHVVIGSKVDCRTMTYGTQDEIQAQIDDTLAVAKDCPGFMFAVGNHIPANVPIENALFYIEHLKANWSRYEEAKA